MSGPPPPGAGAPPPPELNIPGLLGPWVLGDMLASVLCGATLVAATNYYSTFPADRKFYQWTVALLVMISLAAWGMQTYDMWWFTITSRGSPEQLIAVPLVVYAPIFIGATFSQLLSQSFFAFRSYQLCEKNKWVGIGFAVMVFSSFALTFTAAMLVLKNPKFLFNPSLFEYLQGVPGIAFAFKWVPAMHEADLVVSAVSDFLITGALAWKISTQRQGFREGTEYLITRVIRFAISTAAVTTFWEIVTAIVMFTTLFHQNAAFFFLSQFPHLYALVTIASLNLRTALDPNRPRSSRPSRSSGTGGSSHPFKHNSPGFSATNGGIPTQMTGEIKSLGAKAEPFALNDLVSDIQEKDELRMSGTTDSSRLPMNPNFGTSSTTYPTYKQPYLDSQGPPV